MTNIVGQKEITIWLQPEGPGTAYDVYGIQQKAAAMTGKAIPGPGITPVYGRDRFGNPVPIRSSKEPPGDLPNATLMLYETAQISVLKKLLDKGCKVNTQERIRQCGTLDHPNLWEKIRFWGEGTITNLSPGDGPSLTFDDSEVSEEATVTFNHVIELVKTRLTSQTAVTNANYLSIAGMTDEDCNECGTGYPGADQILYIGADAHSSYLTANVLYTVNGGGAWALTTADPFAIGEAVNFIAVQFITESQLRIITATSTADAAATAKIAYADVTLGDEGTTVWTTTQLTGGSVGDVVEAMGWLHFDRLYLASAGDIYLSTDQGETVEVTPQYSGATVINGFTLAPNQDEVYAFGASNLVLREVNKSGTWETLVGPAGGGAFTAMTMSGGNEYLYAGNGQSIFVSSDKAGGAGNWTELKDFGASRVVRKIQCIGGAKAGGGSSELLRVFVDNTTPGSGEVWFSIDGGANFSQVPELTNTGYNDAYWSLIDDNLAIVVGDVQAANGVVHKVSPVN